MPVFGLACEGPTDAVVLENILLGYVDNLDDEEDIQQLQPQLDATDKADTFGGWNQLFSYLKSKRFRDDVANSQYLVIQVDTDVAVSGQLDVLLVDADNKPLDVPNIIVRIKERLIAEIEEGQEGFCQNAENAEKIIFAISVHSIECWLFNLHNKDKNHDGRIHQGFKHLATVLAKDKSMPKLEKTRDCYDTLSMPFYHNKKNIIGDVRAKDNSFDKFVEALPQSI
ncbi:TPA: hypothetical protein NVH54_002648 [Vibrio cholerae]|uniref:hypothetical protein n=1 Tax=Vibrio cholerae TaxID=666 RepID=UPI0011D9AC37|nr:hypothetical protein [Vibrio cholerae]EKY3317877.1 hypothetical protein [Vibrio cholerae]MCR9683626.1 hypothetical protein [Vibrio cholerae]TXX74541.1 hypothetical protein FXE96_18845 [Vibrio cholerae]TXX80344.1 hypothetical protein FXE95_09380 [Vibrio cholerae]GHY80631.1 hypothetical protein VCSRO120_2413 [Vibrio cholerae]